MSLQTKQESAARKVAYGLAGAGLLTACSLTANLDELSNGGGGAGSGGATSSGGGQATTGGIGGVGAGGFGAAGAGAGGEGGVGGVGGAGGALDPYAVAILADNPVAWWRLDETNTPDAFDSSAGAHHGVYSGSVMLQQPGIVVDNPSVGFPGANDKVTIGDDDLGFGGTASFSAEAWIKGEGDGFIVGKLMHDGASYHGWMLSRAPMGAGIRLQRHGVGLIAAGQVIPDEWNHCVGTYDGQTLRVYVNGEFVGQNANANPLGTHEVPVTIAKGDNWGGYGGLVDEVAIYDTNLSDAQVAMHFEAGLAAGR